MKTATIILLMLLISTGGCKQVSKQAFQSDWFDSPDRIWIGPDFWSNRLQDWKILNGELECIQGSSCKPMRTVHLLTRRLKEEDGNFTLQIQTSPVDNKKLLPENAASGFLLGIAPSIDYRAAALVHHSYGSGGGLFAGINGKGQLFMRNMEKNKIILQSKISDTFKKNIVLKLSAFKKNKSYSLTISCIHPDTGRELASISHVNINPKYMKGGIALVSHPGNHANLRKKNEGGRFRFKNFKITGSKIAVLPERYCGPILSSHYTLNNNILKITAQMMPLSKKDNQKVMFQVKDKDIWETIAVTDIELDSYVAAFKIKSWEFNEDRPYRIKYLLKYSSGKEKPYYWKGRINKDPIDKNQFMLAAFTGNHNTARPTKGKWAAIDGKRFPFDSCIWFPHNDIIKNIGVHDPDLLFFSGDQIYEGASPTAADINHSRLDYLYKWYLWCWAFRDLTRNIPCVIIPDDHDVYHGNIWGEGGRATPKGKHGADAQDAGGYKMPSHFVNMVERTQTSHLPDPFDTDPVQQGIGVYYCTLNYGGISFAILEDRKFKSAPRPLLPGARVWNGWAQNKNFNPKTESDVIGAKLLGEAQLKFLQKWAIDWNSDTWMKIVLSQTIFANVATLPEGSMSGSVIPSLEFLKPGNYAENDRPVADMDSNGWPQSGRNEAIKAMRKGFALHIAGDQHLGSTIQYGVEEWQDSGFAICVPSIANFWPRRWFPREGGRNKRPGDPLYCGDFEDGFGNKMTVHAVSNPHDYGKKPQLLHDMAPGYGIITLNKSTREIILENWPRYADPKKGGKPYPGWPVKIHQWDNFNKKDLLYLPTLDFGDFKKPYPLVRIIRESTSETVYAIRPWERAFFPKIFTEGKYTIIIGEKEKKEKQTIFKHLNAQAIKNKYHITIQH